MGHLWVTLTLKPAATALPPAPPANQFPYLHSVHGGGANTLQSSFLSWFPDSKFRTQNEWLGAGGAPRAREAAPPPCPHPHGIRS